MRFCIKNAPKMLKIRKSAPNFSKIRQNFFNSLKMRQIYYISFIQIFAEILPKPSTQSPQPNCLPPSASKPSKRKGKKAGWEKDWNEFAFKKRRVEKQRKNRVGVITDSLFKGRRNEKLGSIEKSGDKGHFRRTKMGSICVAQICLYKRLSKRGAFEKVDFLITFALSRDRV